MRKRRILLGRGLAALTLLASLAAVLATGSPASAAETTVTIHKKVCSTDVSLSQIFQKCHIAANSQSGINFNIAGRNVTTNASGVTATVVPTGQIRVRETSPLTDGGQYIYCSTTNRKPKRVLFNDTRVGGSIFLRIRAGEHVVCDWYNLVRPVPQGITLNIHAFECPANTRGDYFTACHNRAHAKEGVAFQGDAGGGFVAGTINAQGRLTLALSTVATGRVSVQVEEEVAALTKDGAFVFCSSAGNHGKGDILGGVTVYNGVINIGVQDGTTVTCDWFNLTP
ncbi:MAG: hypothetical protein QOF33_3222 [Thermomicrobiales bacterium]|nr:hypothetical protein [Thermomicrobiales bacterium]